MSSKKLESLINQPLIRTNNKIELNNSDNTIKNLKSNEILKELTSINLFTESEILADQNSNSNSSINNSSHSENSSLNTVNIGDQRTMDAADTLVSLANTPTTEFKSLFNNLPPNNNLEIVYKYYFLFL
jgi:hypothetical protein